MKAENPSQLLSTQRTLAGRIEMPIAGSEDIGGKVMSEGLGERLSPPPEGGRGLPMMCTLASTFSPGLQTFATGKLMCAV